MTWDVAFSQWMEVLNVYTNLFPLSQGVIATGLFTKGELLLAAFGREEHVGWFYEWGRGSGDFTLMGAQLILVAFIFGWVFSIMGGYFHINLDEDEQVCSLTLYESFLSQQVCTSTFSTSWVGSVSTRLRKRSAWTLVGA